MSNFFLICSSYFSKQIKDTETTLFREKQQGSRLHFGPTKFLSSSMTPSFFCQKYMNFISFKFLGSFSLELLYLMTETKYGVMVSLTLRGLCRLRFRLKLTSNFFSLWIVLGKKVMKNFCEVWPIFFQIVSDFSQN